MSEEPGWLREANAARRRAEEAQALADETELTAEQLAEWRRLAESPVRYYFAPQMLALLGEVVRLRGENARLRAVANAARAMLRCESETLKAECMLALSDRLRVLDETKGCA